MEVNTEVWNNNATEGYSFGKLIPISIILVNCCWRQQKDISFIHMDTTVSFFYARIAYRGMDPDHGEFTGFAHYE